jgi:hypothetical protein
VKILRTSFWSASFCAHGPGYCLTFISYELFDLNNKRFSKKSIFISCSVLTDFYHYLRLHLDLFLFEFFWSRNFWEICYSSLCFNGCYTWVETEPKSGFTILHALMLLIRIVWSFVWRKFSSVEKGEWWDEMKYGQKLKLGDAHVTPRNIQEVQASKLGDAPRHPFFIDKYQVIFQDTIFLLLRILCVFLGASLFLLSVLFCFVFCNKWLDPNIFLLEKTHSIFIAKNTLVFTLIVQRVFSFSSTAFSFHFLPWFLFRTCQFFVARCVYTSGLCCFSFLRVVSKNLIGVGKEKKVSCL